MYTKAKLGCFNDGRLCAVSLHYHKSVLIRKGVSSSAISCIIMPAGSQSQKRNSYRDIFSIIIFKITVIFDLVIIRIPSYGFHLLLLLISNGLFKRFNWQDNDVSCFLVKNSYTVQYYFINY